MNHYHIYEAIGRGKYSTVYKGRKKKTIEYFAVKSIDKSQRNKVLQEVRILHSLYHPNVLKFYTWYETSAHLWLVLEYCVGGDLMYLLRQDGHLPEESIHDLAYNLLKALQYIHSQGIIYCDLKPSNILLDENGCTKLCDFGLARRLSDISKTPTSALPPAKRGTPCYMAPELFEDGGVHSYASDFWALGCVLYECYAGRPPFIDREFTQLVKSILSDPTPPLPGSPSRPFMNLINCLLIKDPAERIKWSELCGHAFWRNKFTDMPLPSQPAISNMIELHAKPCLSECVGERSLRNKTPPKHHEKDAKGPLKQDENSVTTPAKSAVSAHKTQTRTPGKGAEDKPKTTRLVNLLRLSRIAKTNLQRENEKENYRRPLATDPENDSEVKIENTDMELDFNESAEDETPEEPDGYDIPNSTAANHPKKENREQDNMEEMDIDMQADAAAVSDEPVLEDPRAANQEPCLDAAQVATSPPSVSPQLRGQRTKENSQPAPENASPKLSNNLSEIFWHPSDLSVRPVMPSRKSDKASEVIPSLPFEALQVSDFVKMSKEQLEAFTSRILAILNGNTRHAEKQNVLRYLEMLSSNPDAANVLTNGTIMLVLVKMLRLSKVAVLRVQLASLIGLLIRHSTFIDDELSNSEIIGSLKEGLRDGQEKVRRFSMAALGELLFYISTQNEQNNRENNPPESPSKDNRSASGWQVQNSLISLVSSTLRKGEDDMTQLYALRTIENICSQGGHWAGRFTSQDVITNLCYIYRAPGKPENMRLTAGSCLVRLIRFGPPTIQLVIEKLPLKDIASAIDSSSKRIACALDKGSARDQQIRINLLIMAMLASHIYTNVNRHISQLTEVKNLASRIISLMEQGTEILRGKALVFVALLCKSSRKWLLQFFSNTSLMSTVDRLSKEKDDYLRQCINASVQVVASVVPGLLDSISGYIQHTIGGRRPATASPINNRMVPKTTLQFQLFAIVLNLLGSPSFKRRIATHEVLQQLANIVKLAENPFQGRDDLQLTLLRVIETLTEEPSWVLESSDVFVGILPSLAVIYKGNNNGNARFLCLKILFDVMITLLNDSAEQILEALKSISYTHFLPIYPILVEDEDPIPMYAQKLLLMLIEFDYIKVQDILHPKTVSRCFGFLLGDLSNANVNDVKLCLALASAPEMESKLLSQLKAVRRIGNLLEFAHVKEMEDFLEPTLSLCRAFLLHSMRTQQNFNYREEPALLSETSSEESSSINQQEGIRDIMDFGSNAGVFLELSRSHDKSVSDMASECIILLLKAAPREGTVGVLTNLSKVSTILDSFQKHASHHLIVLRMLHALGYSCRQYISHAMILSLSMSDILKIEGIVTEMKSSSTRALANAAMLVSLELRRLPHCN